MMSRRCALRPPAHTLVPKGVDRPADVGPWDEANVTALHSPGNRKKERLFQPDGDGPWDHAIRSSQFPARCHRFLLIKIDTVGMGMGYMSRILAAALLIAVRENRVLIEIPINGTADLPRGATLLGRLPSKGFGLRSPWCDRAPFTLQCFFQPWTHCDVPPDALLRAPPRKPAVLATSIMRLNVQPTRVIWQGHHSSAQGAAIRHLFRPRRWVQRLGDCVMSRAELRPSKFLSIHVRDSPEKRKEAAGFGIQNLPPLSDYTDLMRAYGKSIHLQTANAAVLRNVTDEAARAGLLVGYTNNTRADHDSWGGWDDAQIMEQGLVAAVNAYIGSLAGVFMSLSISTWTAFVASLMGPETEAAAIRCGILKRMPRGGAFQGAFISTVHSAGAVPHGQLAALVRRAPDCRLTYSLK